jgi:iron-sulfur cluster assembly protein
LISGTTIDFIDGHEGTGFSFDNPHAKSKGGCGKSCC